MLSLAPRPFTAAAVSLKFAPAILVLTLGALCGLLRAEDFPVWGHDVSRNMVSPEKGLPGSFVPGKPKPDSEEIDLATTKNVKWVAKLGSQCYGNPTIAGGKVFVGTNNESPRDPKHQGDRGVLMCFEEGTGKFLWQLVSPKLGAGKVSDWEFLGLCSSPAVEGDRAYIVTNRCEVLCVDVNGLANGNDGPFQDEGQYIAGPGKPKMELAPTDGDILWRFDMRDELGVFPHNITSSSVLLLEDRLFVTTSNGQDWSHVNIPAPQAPCLVCLDKKTGKLLGEEHEGIGKRLYHCNWSSPTFGKVGGRGLVIFGAGDGFCHAFDPAPAPVAGEDGLNALKEVWRYDCNPPEHKTTKDGKFIKYPAADGPSEVIATPVFYKERIYVAVGQDPEHGNGVGNLSCIDATKTGDVTKDGKVWSYDKLSRSISTVSIADGLVYAADYAGSIHALDAETGTAYWVQPTGSHIWGSTFVADGKVYVGTEDGELWVLAAGKEANVLAKVSLEEPIYSTPVAANGVLYVATQTRLYAVRGEGK
ncbi:MAG: PQQ-binding-like beta-propeller repeat protein [Planctomycetes bacterium]|nr:PQQ-binding-like beta-propeller repeat protein [Planctomycetota bacterium]